MRWMKRSDMGLSISAGAKSILPLLVGELVQALAQPADVGNTDVIEQRLVPAAIFETDLALIDAANERCGFEHPDVTAWGIDHACSAERLAKIPGDIPARCTFAPTSPACR